MFRKLFFVLLFLLVLAPLSECSNKNIKKIENILENNLSDGVYYLTKCLADFNDNHLGKSEWGRWIGYDNMKPAFNENGRGLKKMSMSMMPLVFHVGASSTWMLLTSLMAAKSVAIGLLLLVFKIAVSSAKVASFFTLLKSKSGGHHEHSWSSGHERSLTEIELPSHNEWQSYSPEWSPSDPITGYKTIPTYKENAISQYEVSEIAQDKRDKNYG